MKNSAFKLLILVSLLPTGILSLYGAINVLGGNTDPWVALVLLGGSLLATSLLIFLIQSRIIRPLEALISKLRNEHPRVSDHNRLSLSETINSYLLCIDQDHKTNIAELEEKLSSLESKAREFEIINRELEQINNQLTRASSLDKEIDDLLVRLFTHHLKTIVGSINALESGNETDHKLITSELRRAAETCLFINRELKDETTNNSLENIETWQLLDELLEQFAPISNSLNGNTSIRVDDACPGRLILAGDEVKALIFEYLLYYFAHGKPTAHRVINLDFKNSKLTISIAGYSFPDISARRQNLLKNTENSVQNTLVVPAEAVTSRDEPGKGLTAIVVCENHEQRECIILRLKQYGVSITSDFRSRELHFCIIDDEESQSFKGIRPYLSPATHLFLMKSNTLYQRKNIHHIKNPLNHRELVQLLSGLIKTMPILHRYSVLAVDDNESNLHLLALQLKELGHHVITATNGEAAVKLYQNNHFDLVFMDIQMPGVDGLEATRLIRQSPGNIPPILGLTAHATNEEKQGYLNAGMDQVLMKPLRIDNLRSILDHQIQKNEPKHGGPASGQYPGPFNYELAISRANNRPEIADELFQLLITTLPSDINKINQAARSGVKDDYKSSVHRLNGAVRYCGVPGLAHAIDHLESRIKISIDESSEQALHNANREVTSLLAWHQDNPDPFNIQMKHKST